VCLCSRRSQAASDVSVLLRLSSLVRALESLAGGMYFEKRALSNPIPAAGIEITRYS
jgi:hypothetical protein